MLTRGCLIECRIAGILEAVQKEKEKKKKVRNDRIIAISSTSILYSDITDVKELNKHMVGEVENFFIDYNKHEGKVFKPIKWSGKAEAEKMVHKLTTE